MPGEGWRRRLRALLGSARVPATDLGAIERAFVHESAAREAGSASNERLEFLGDSILGLIVAHALYLRYPDESEGRLHARKAAIVSDAQLAKTARRLGFTDLVDVGVGMRNAGGADNTTVLADAFEAFIGAVYLTCGLDAARTFVEREHVAHVEHAPETTQDAKTRLQHLAQERWAATPVYRDVESGSAQRPAFRSRVIVNGRVLGAGSGPSKKIAQQSAAQNALAALRAPAP